jgi:hypothetical protein
MYDSSSYDLPPEGDHEDVALPPPAAKKGGALGKRKNNADSSNEDDISQDSASNKRAAKGSVAPKPKATTAAASPAPTSAKAKVAAAASASASSALYGTNFSTPSKHKAKPYPEAPAQASANGRPVRARIGPLQFWKGERQQYGASKIGDVAITAPVAIMSGWKSEQKAPRPHVAKKLKKNSTSSPSCSFLK